jgi:hypothetical protein
MKNAVFFFALLWVLIAEAQAQQARRRLSYSQLFEEIQKHPDTVYRLENAEIYYNDKTDHTRFGYVKIPREKLSSMGFSIFSFGKILSWRPDNEINEMEKTEYIKPNIPNLIGRYNLFSIDMGTYGYSHPHPEYEKYLDSLLPVITINKSIILRDVYWSHSTSFAIRRFRFKKDFIFYFSENKDNPATKNKELVKVPSFEKCEFEQLLEIQNSSSKISNDSERETTYFLFCKFFEINADHSNSLMILKKNSIKYFNSREFNQIELADCKINRLRIRSPRNNNFAENITIKNCHFIVGEKNETFEYGLSISSFNAKQIKIDSCTFEKVPDEWKKKNDKIWNEAGLQDVSCEKLSISNSVFNSHFYLIGCKVSEEFFLENNEFRNDFSLGSGSAKSGFAHNIINLENAYIPYKQFQKGLSTEIKKGKTTVYYGNTHQELADEIEYDHLVTYYNKFLKVYRDQNDKVSYNACFVALKRLETRRLGYLYSKNRTNLDLWLQWKFNELLDYLCEYGTNPFLALSHSIRIMLLFALFLCFFASSKDYLQPSEFRGALQRWGLALQKEGGFTEIYSEEVQKKLDNLESFRKTLELSTGNVPSVLAFFLQPLFFSAKLYYNLQKWFLRRIDFTRGNWQEMSRKKRMWVSMRIFVAIVLLLFWGLFMRVLNSLALSMNCFVTLGYGEIKAKGIAKYLVVLEGVFGWTMLTIFSASLITQLMG